MLRDCVLNGFVGFLDGPIVKGAFRAVRLEALGREIYREVKLPSEGREGRQGT